MYFLVLPLCISEKVRFTVFAFASRLSSFL